MQALKTLLFKELIEHKIVTRLPLFLAAFAMINIVLLMLNLDQLSFNFSLNGNTALSEFLSTSDRFAGVVGGLNMAIAGLVYVICCFNYVANTLLKERQEGSLAFWHSMPVSEPKAIGVKLFFALVVIPMIATVLLLVSDVMVLVMGNIIATSGILNDYSVTFSDLLVHVFSFMSSTMAVSLALLPAVCAVLYLSLYYTHPLLMLFLIIVVVRVTSYVVLGSSLISDWLRDVLQLPFHILMSETPWLRLEAIGGMTLALMLAISGVLFCLTVRKRAVLG